MDGSSDIKALFIVVNAGFSADVMDIAREAGVKGATILNARGEGMSHKSIMGITVDIEKEIILCLIDNATAERAMAVIDSRAGRRSPAHGVCFILPVDKTTEINNFLSPVEKKD